MRGFTVARVAGVPLELHWSVPIGLLVFGRFAIVPAFWAGLFALVLLHELGHAAVARACGKKVERILLHGAGGLCYWSGTATAVERSLIAWGGVAAQVVVLAVAVSADWIWMWSSGPRGRQLEEALIIANVLMMALNLLPLGRLDGAEAWRLFARLYRRGTRVRPRFTTFDAHDDVEATPEVRRMLEDVLAKARRGKR